MTAASSPEPARAGAGVLHHSYLYAPGTRPDVMRKALRSGADVVLLDLEDAVPDDRKGEARASVLTLMSELVDHGFPSQVGGPEVHVRINVDGHWWNHDDLEAIVSPALSAVRLPKAEDPTAIHEVSAVLDRLERQQGIEAGRIGLYPLIESAVGMDRARDLLSGPRVVRAALGTSDLLADLGVLEDTPDTTGYLRGKLVLDSRLAGAGPPIDSVHTDLDDLDGLRRAATWARDMGFVGKSLIHPRQIAPAHEAFTPTAAEVDRATALLDRVGDGASRDGSQFVDPAVVARARSVLRLQRNP